MSGSISAASSCTQGLIPAGRTAEAGSHDGFGNWRLSSRLEFGPLPTAVPCARLHARHIFWEWNLAHRADDAELIVSELMTNAFKATRAQQGTQPIILHLLANNEYLMIQIWDAFAEVPAPRPHAMGAETGRGLEIVALLSDKWGFCHPAGGGKIVWAALTTEVAPSTPRGAGA